MRFRLPQLFAPWYRWHRWFAWHPVTVDGSIVWLEYVERYIGGFCGIGHYYEYRLFTLTRGPQP
jgi:hypothetical protein